MEEKKDEVKVPEYALDEKTLAFLRKRNQQAIEIGQQVQGVLQMIIERESLQGTWAIDWEKGRLFQSQPPATPMPMPMPPTPAPPQQQLNGEDKTTLPV